MDSVDSCASRETLRVSARRIANDKVRVAEFVASEIRREALRSQEEALLSAIGAEASLVERAAATMPLQIIELLEGDPAGDAVYISEEELPGLAPVVFLRPGLSHGRRRRAATHEMAHHLQRTRVALALYDADTVICNELDGREIRHEIARAVERLVGE